MNWLLKPAVFTDSIVDAGVIALQGDLPRPWWTGKPRVALLVHGVACTWRFMAGLAHDLRSLAGPRPEGRKRYGAVALIAMDWRQGIETSAQALGRRLQVLGEHACAFDLFGYSQGGLVARKALRVCGPRGPRVDHCVTFNAPHRGSPLPAVARWRSFRMGARYLAAMARWDCEGLRDMVERSPFLSEYVAEAPPPGTSMTYIAGDAGRRFLGGWTQFFFGRVANDGVVTVDSQLDRGPRAGIDGPDRSAQARSSDRVAPPEGLNEPTRLVLPWDHFTLGLGPPARPGPDDESSPSPRIGPWLARIGSPNDRDP